jgi:ABC-type uncharacterized transport system substrate-binding protein
LGYVEGENLIIERYSAEGHHERLIVTGTNPVVIAFRAATSTIPIVAFMLDPLKAGLVTSLARPGGNLTGITLDAGIEIWGKRLEMLKEAIPSTAKAAFLGMRDGWDESFGQVLREAGGRLGISLIWMLPQAGTRSEIERVFAAMGQQQLEAVLVSAELLRRMANDVHQILNGAKPGDIPIYQPTKFELLINLKTANAFGLTLPHSLLSRADEIIE